MKFIFVCCGQVAICVCILWPGDNLCLYIVARWRFVYVYCCQVAIYACILWPCGNLCLYQRFYLQGPSCHPLSNLVTGFAFLQDLIYIWICIDPSLTLTSEGCLDCAKVWPKFLPPHLTLASVGSNMREAWKLPSPAWPTIGPVSPFLFSVGLIFFDNFRSMYFQMLLWLPKHLKISSLAARTISGRLDIGTHTSVAKSLFCWVRKEFSDADVSNEALQA